MRKGRGVIFVRRTLQNILDAATLSPRAKRGLAGGTKNRTAAIETATNLLAAIELAQGTKKRPAGLDSLVAELRRQAENTSLAASHRVLACTRLAVIEGVLPTSALDASATSQLIRTKLGEHALDVPIQIAPSPEPGTQSKPNAEHDPVVDAVRVQERAARAAEIHKALLQA